MATFRRPNRYTYNSRRSNFSRRFRRPNNKRGTFRNRRFEKRDKFRSRRTFRRRKPLTKEELDNDLDNYYKTQNNGENCKSIK